MLKIQKGGNVYKLNIILDFCKQRKKEKAVTKYNVKHIPLCK